MLLIFIKSQWHTRASNSVSKNQSPLHRGFKRHGESMSAGSFDKHFGENLFFVMACETSTIWSIQGMCQSKIDYIVSMASASSFDITGKKTNKQLSSAPNQIENLEWKPLSNHLVVNLFRNVSYFSNKRHGIISFIFYCSWKFFLSRKNPNCRELISFLYRQSVMKRNLLFLTPD